MSEQKLKPPHSLIYNAPSLDHLYELHYCIGGTDKGTELQGTFAFEHDLYILGAGRWSISPIFETADEFYDWAKRWGFIYHKLDEEYVLCKGFS